MERNLTPQDIALLDKITQDLPITADLCRSDLLLYVLAREGEVKIRAQAHPRSSATLYQEDKVGELESEETLGGFGGPYLKTCRLKALNVRGANVARQIFPIRNDQGALIGMLAQDAYWLAYERHRRRAKPFQQALLDFVWMVIHGRLQGTEELSPFREYDGIMYVDANGYIRYMSGICAEMYRGLGYRDSLINRQLRDVDTIDYEIFQQATTEGRALERSVEQAGGLYIRKALPIVSQDRSPWGHLRRRIGTAARSQWRNRGAFLLIHNATEAVRVQRERESQLAFVREVHHRVKNNLQVIASILRMEARRAQSEETRAALEDGVQRILSVAVVHEFLSQQAEGATINLRDVAERIIAQVQRSLIPPDKQIAISFSGPDIWLPAERATQCALIINELVQNAIEHGMAHRTQGHVRVELVDDGASVTMRVTDDGEGLGDDFNLDTQANLGLTLVKSMTERDLRGRFEIKSEHGETRAQITFEK